MTQFGIEPIYGSTAVVVVVIAAILAVMVLITPPTAHPAHRRLLIGLRSLAAILLCLAALGPAWIRTDPQPTDATLVVAVDTSRSMTLPNGDGADRWTTQREVWRRLADQIQDLDESLQVSLLAYDAAAIELPDPAPDSLDERTPEGERTDLGAALTAAIQGSEGKPLAGVVLIGDGTDTSGSGGVDTQRVAQTLNSIGVPLWSVPIGPATDGSGARDVAVEGLPETLELFADNEVEIGFEVRMRGLAGSEVPVRLTWVDAEGESEEAVSRRAVAERSLDTVAMRVPLIVPPPGTYRLVAEADRQSGELITENNRQIAFVEVRKGGGRVLYLEGTPRLEQLFLRRALHGFPDLDLTYQWIPADTANRWPVGLGRWFEPGEFDLYLLGDLDATALGDQQLQDLADSVAAGAGLITLGGFQTYGAGGYADSPLAEVIPVRMDAGRRRGIDDEHDDADQLPGPLQAVPARSHSITNLGDDPADAWQELPPLSGANRLLGPKAAPGVQVLLETPEDDPLLVIGEYGRGRTAALAIDSTYRWWRGGNQEAHRRFWRQLMLWVLAREEMGDDLIRIELDTRRFPGDAEPSFRAGVQTLQSSLTAELAAELIDEQGDSVSLPVSGRVADDSTTAAVQGRLPELQPGFYRLRVRDERAGSTLNPAEAAFQVIDDSRELEQPMADPVYLRQLAEITADHGGETFTPDHVDRLIERISERRQRGETTVVEKSRLGDGPLSGWLLFLLFAAALSLEWALRRRWGMA